eukprot:364949-Chlamydomonas_euryale.AAC.4
MPAPACAHAPHHLVAASTAVLAPPAAEEYERELRKDPDEPGVASDPGLCEDLHDMCAKWAEHGECENNPEYMSLVDCHGTALMYVQRVIGAASEEAPQKKRLEEEVDRLSLRQADRLVQPETLPQP